MMIENKLIELFTHYQNAFENFDMDALADCYLLPCVLHGPDQIAYINNKAAFEIEFEAVFTQLKAANVCNVNVAKSSFESINDQIVNVIIDWIFIDSEQNVYTELTAFYQVYNDNGTLKITSVVSHMTDNAPRLTTPLNLA